MIKVASVSGGRTSSYLALHYPVDHLVFALVRCEDASTLPKDKGIIRAVEDRIQTDFTGTPEDNKTIDIVLKLEQELGQKINWVTGPTFDQVIANHQAIPNREKRFCTTDMKMHPIFEWWYENIGEIVQMGVGFRLDEFERSERFTTEIKYRFAQNIFGQFRYKWNTVVWREGWFPLIDDAITIKDVTEFWSKRTGWIFPLSSNCQNCFWKSDQELRQNWDDNPEVMEWASKKEKELGYSFRDTMTMEQISQMGLQQTMHFGGGSCKSDGWCMD